MISNELVTAFTNAARALVKGKKDTGYTGNGLKKLDFVVRVKDEDTKKVLKKTFTAMEQNLDKLSTPAQQARNGHSIIQIRDADKGILVGNVDVDENRFNSYEAVPQPMDINDIVDALGDDAVDEGDVAVTAARTSIPSQAQPEPSRKQRRAA